MIRSRHSLSEPAFPELREARSRAQRRETLTTLVLLLGLAALALVVMALFATVGGAVSWVLAAAAPYLPSFAPSPDAAVRLLLALLPA